MGQNTTIAVLASRAVPVGALSGMVQVVSLEDWVSAASLLWDGPLPICVLLAQKESAALLSGEAEDFLANAGVPVIEMESANAETVARVIFERVLEAEAEARGVAADLRAQSAVLRRDFMQLQRSFSVVEDFLTTVFAPQFTCARHWDFAGESMAAGGVRQRLPVGSPGLVAVDIWAMGAGTAELRFARETGADFGPKVALKSTGEGWVRAMLPVPLAGLAEDVVIEVKANFALGLSLPTPVAYLDASAAPAPLALRVWKGLPGVKLPNMQPSTKERFIIPASALPLPEVQGGMAKRLRGREAFSLHPGHDGKMDFAFKGIEVPSAANIAVYTQNFGPESVTLSLAAFEGDVARAVPLPPESHVQVDLSVAEAGKVDLYFKLRARSPVCSVFIRGIEICPLPE